MESKHAALDLSSVSGTSATSRNEALVRLTRLAASLLDVSYAVLLRIHTDRYEVQASYITNPSLAAQAETLFPAVVASGGAFLLDDSFLGELEEQDHIPNGHTLKFLYCLPVTSGTGALLGTLCLANTKAPLLDRASIDLMRDVASMMSMELIRREKKSIDSLFERLLVSRNESSSPAEKAEIHDDTYFRILIEHISDVIILHDAAGKIRYVSPGCYGLSGYEPNELVNVDILSLVHPKDRKRCLRLVEVAQSGEPTQFSYRLMRNDGSYVWVETITRTLFNEQTGNVREILSITRDISKRKQAEVELKLREEWWYLLVELNPAPLLISQGDTLLYMNRAGLDLIGAASMEQVSGQSVASLLNHPLSTEEEISYQAQWLSTSGDGAVVGTLPDGATRASWIQWSYPEKQPTPTFDKDYLMLAKAIYASCAIAEEEVALNDAPEEGFLTSVRVHTPRTPLHRPSPSTNGKTSRPII